MSAPDDSYRTTPTWELIDDLLDNRPDRQRLRANRAKPSTYRA